MTDGGPESGRLRPAAYDERAYNEDAAAFQPISIVSAGSRGARVRRRFHWGEHPLAEVEFGIAGFFALSGWLAVGMLILMLVDDRDGPEGMTGLAVAFGMPPLLVVALGCTAVAAFVWHKHWGERVSLVVAVTAVGAAVILPVAWVALLF